MNEEPKKISDYIDIEALQTIQDSCSQAMGLAFVTVDYRGIPITEFSGFTPYCALGRTSEVFAELCEKCDAHGGLRAAITGESYIYRCHAGLIDFAVPLILNESYMGAVLGGQVRLFNEEQYDLERILTQQNDWHEDAKLMGAYEAVEAVTYEKLESAVEILRDIIIYEMQESHKLRIEEPVTEKDTVIVEKDATASELEYITQKQELESSACKEGCREFFFVMNEIAVLAQEERAVKTEAVVFDFTDIVRYSIDFDRKISSLREELGYLAALLRIKKTWYREVFSYSISVSDQHGDTTCPFLLFKVVVESMLAGLGEREGCSRCLDISSEEVDGDILVRIAANGESPEYFKAQLGDENDDMSNSLKKANRGLRQTLGDSGGLAVNKRLDGRPGTEISFRLPRKKRIGTEVQGGVFLGRRQAQ